MIETLKYLQYESERACSILSVLSFAQTKTYNELPRTRYRKKIEKRMRHYPKIIILDTSK